MKKGFTLIELLVVIAILAVLATATVLVLNPAELLRQGRDSTRISDMAALNNAIALWTADVLNTSGYWNATSTTTWGAGLATSTKPGGGTTYIQYTSSTAVSGTGWVNLNLGLIAAGSPLSRLPMDPNNGSTCRGATTIICRYAWSASSTVGNYELNAQMESVKFYLSGSADVTSKDGGNMTDIYEVGTNLTLF